MNSFHFIGDWTPGRRRHRASRVSSGGVGGLRLDRKDAAIAIGGIAMSSAAPVAASSRVVLWEKYRSEHWLAAASHQARKR
jgi:hypothetical protein